MNYESLEQIKHMINSSSVVSFDVFDTLLFRKVNFPEDVFEIMESFCNIPDFPNIRKRAQAVANERVQLIHGYPHANIDEIYEEVYLQDSRLNDVDKIKSVEMNLEKDLLVPNNEIMDIYEYACRAGKRIIAITDMYFSAKFIKDILQENGYEKIEKVYCSADMRATKWQGSLYDIVRMEEKIDLGKIVHIGDDEKSDVEVASRYGIKSILYSKEGYDKGKYISVPSTVLDDGLRKILCNTGDSFWYNFAIEAGGPVYMGLLQWFCEKNPNKDSKIFLLSRDGYVLYKLLRKLGYENAKYLYASRRSLILLGITDMNDADISIMPPFTVGQTVKEVLEYLCIDVNDIKHLCDAGFYSFDDVIKSYDEVAKFKNLYVLDREVFIKRAEYERRNAKSYFNKEGVFDDDAVLFDCGWSGTSQFLYDRFLKATNIHTNNKFYYFGITNDVRSKSQMSGLNYEKYLDDWNINNNVLNHQAMYELLFGAPQEALLFYGENKLVFENGSLITGKDDIERGISDYIDLGYDLACKYGVKYGSKEAVGHLQKIIFNPSESETEIIGNLQNVDSYQVVKGKKKRMAYIIEEEYLEDRNVAILWPEGFLRRKDVSEELKLRVARDRGYKYPIEDEVVYNLEGLYDLENYCYFRKNNSQNEIPTFTKFEGPKFSVVMPVYNTVSNQLRAAIDSVLSQTYDNFELILVDDNSTWNNVKNDLRAYENDNRVTIIYRDSNGGISECTNTGLNIATGEYITFVDCDDILEMNALYEFAIMITEHPEYDFIYSDQDKVTEDGLIFHSPFFKPDWSPDLFMTEMYTNHLAVYRADIAKNLGGLNSEYNGAQDYDFTLRFMEKSDKNRVGHIPKVLYHWRERKESIAYSIESKHFALKAVEKLKTKALCRLNIKGHIEYVPAVKQYRIVYEIVDNPFVSVIIYGKNADKVQNCISYVKGHTSYDNFEIIKGNTAKEYGEQITEMVKRSRGEYLLFLDSDVRIIRNDWLNIMLGHTQQKDIGAVGAKLLYKDTPYIRHCGISIVDKKPNRDFWRSDDSKICSFGFNIVDRNCTAVSRECLCISKTDYDEMGGFDRRLRNYADVDLCMSLLENGKYNVLRNDVVLSYEANSYEWSLDDVNDLDILKEKHPTFFIKDSFLNYNLKCYSEYLDYKDFPKDTIRISGYSSDDRIDIRPKKRRLVISDSNNNALRVDVTDVPRVDVLKKYNHDYNHLWDGFVALVSKDELKEEIKSYNFSMEYECENGEISVVPAYFCEDDYETTSNKKIRAFAARCRKIYIYGAGVYGKQCYAKFKAQGVDVNAFVVTKKKQNEKSPFEVDIVEFDSIKDILDKKEVGIVVALKPVFRSQVVPLLKENGFDNLITYPFDIF